MPRKQPQQPSDTPESTEIQVTVEDSVQTPDQSPAVAQPVSVTKLDDGRIIEDF